MGYKKVPLLAYLCVLPVLLALGVWQLNRAEEKRTLIALQKQRQGGEVLDLAATLPDGQEQLLYKPVKATGHYDGNHQYLLDNQVNKGRAGYFVFTPFLLKGESKAVLVNRGWVPLGKSRSELPTVDVPADEITLAGRVNRFPTIGIALAGSEIASKTWPSVVQIMDYKLLSGQLGYALFDFQLELGQKAPDGFVREWHAAQVMTPEKHTGYAVQWFLLAFTLTVLFIKYGLKK